MPDATTDSQNVLIGDQWRAADAADTFQSTDPSRNQPLGDKYPVSRWSDCQAALQAAAGAARKMRRLPAARIAEFLEAYADRIEANREELAQTAFTETGLAKSPRLADVEIPRTFNQLRAAAAACRSGSWAMPTIDTKLGIRSCYRPIGPVLIFGPNNFPFAFNGASGGDFAAAVAAGNPVIVKSNPGHPGTTRRLCELAAQAAKQTGLPDATVQLIYHMDPQDGLRMVSDKRLGAVAFTGGRAAGLKLKVAADAAGIPIYLELSSINPVVITPAALQERGDKIAEEYLTSVLMGAGQFCTNPGVVFLVKDTATETFIQTVTERFKSAAAGTLLSPAVAKGLTQAVQKLNRLGAEILAGGGAAETDRCAVANTLLRIDGQQFLSDPDGFQTEAFGNAGLLVVADDVDQLTQCLSHVEGNLTGCIYTAMGGSDESHYEKLAFELEPKVGRLLNDKMPTGVAVSPAMNHGGPYPSTGHPGFTGVGIPASLIRFGKLTSFDNVRADRLPKLLQDAAPTGEAFRMIDGVWRTGPL